MRNTTEEQILNYPLTWESEYKETGFVKLWRERYPELFEDYKGNARLGTLDLFPQYALMFLLPENKESDQSPGTNTPIHPNAQRTRPATGTDGDRAWP